MRARRLIMATAAVLASVLAGCGWATVDIGGADGASETQAEDAADVTDFGEIAEDADVGEVPAGCPYEIVLLMDSSQPVQSQTGESLVIKAKVIDLEAEQPASGVGVTFEITGATDAQGQPVQGGGQLGSLTAYTDEQGVAHFPFACGLVPDVVYEVTVWIDSDLCAGASATKTLEIECAAAPPCACVNVSLVYEGGLAETALSDFKIHVVPADWGCDKLFPEKPVPASLADRTIADLHGSTTFECLPADNYYTLYVTAKGPHACVAAAGCNDGVYLKPDTCKDANVQLYLVTLNTTGMYDRVDRLDFTQVLSVCAGGDVTPADCISPTGGVGQQVCCTLLQLVNLFQTPATFFADLMLDLAKQAGGPWTGVETCPWIVIEDAAAKLIDYYSVLGNPIEVNFGNPDILEFISHVDLSSDLALGMLTSGYSLHATQYWTGLSLYWKKGCDPKDPGYGDCGKVTFTKEMLAGTQYPIDIPASEFTASLVDFDKLIQNVHAIEVAYGRVVLLALNEVVMPDATAGKANTVREAVGLMFDCKSIAPALLDEIAYCFTGTLQDVLDLCEATLDAMCGPVQVFVSGLLGGSTMSLQGNATLVDEDCDLKVDKIVKGVEQGMIGPQSEPFTATYEATKKP
jgi:hypothetical protein